MIRQARFAAILSLALLLVGGGSGEITANADGSVRVEAIDIASYPQVELNVTAIGPDGKPARSLDRSSFEITQSGRPVSSLNVEEHKSGPITAVIAIDTSGGQVNYYEESKTLALELVDLLGAEDAVGLTTFDNRTDPILAPTTDRELIRQGIEQVAALEYHFTAFYTGLYQSVRLASESSTPGKVVILLTDGEEFRPEGEQTPVSPEEVKALAAEHGVQVHTVYIGADPPSALFQEIANITGGLRFDSSVPQDASGSVASRIASHLDDSLRSHYTVSFTAAPPDRDEPFDPTVISLSAKVGATVDTSFSLCQYGAAPFAWLPHLPSGSGISNQQSIDPEIVCATSAVNAMRFIVDGAEVANVIAAPFSHRIVTDKMARGEHAVRVEVDLMDGTTLSTPVTTVLVSGNAFNPAYLLLILGIGLAILFLFMAASRRRQSRHRLATPGIVVNDFEFPSSFPPAANASVAPSGAGALPALAASAAQLKVIRGPNEGQTYSLSDGITLGRSLGAGVLLSGSSVSREHARITNRAGVYQIRDLGSTNGTKVNGRKVSEAPLNTGDQIEIAPYVLQFEA